MKVKSSKPKGQRIFKCVKSYVKSNHSLSRKIKRPFLIKPIGKDWWFDLDIGQWYQNYDSNRDSISDYYSLKSFGYRRIYSLKAAKRLIYKWNVPKGTKFNVDLPYIGYSFIITK